MKKNSGFTLVEVLVALGVLNIGSLAFYGILNFFIQMKVAERGQSAAFIDAADRIELLKEKEPPCDSLEVYVPGIPLAWVSVSVPCRPPAHTVHFRRLIRCRL